MTKKEQVIDEIDRELFGLESRALRLCATELAEAIRKARIISFYLLPESRRKELTA